MLGHERFVHLIIFLRFNGVLKSCLILLVIFLLFILDVGVRPVAPPAPLVRTFGYKMEIGSAIVTCHDFPELLGVVDFPVKNHILPLDLRFVS